MVDMLVESSSNVEMILKFFDMFLKLKDLTSSDTFKEYDPDGKGVISKRDFHIPAVTREYTTGSCRNSRKPMRLSPPCEVRPDSPALCPEQLWTELRKLTVI